MSMKVKVAISTILEVARVVFCLVACLYGITTVVALGNFDENAYYLHFMTDGYIAVLEIILFASYFYLVSVLLTKGWQDLRKSFNLPDPIWAAPCFEVAVLSVVGWFVLGLIAIHFDLKSDWLIKGLAFCLNASSFLMPWCLVSFVLAELVGSIVDARRESTEKANDEEDG